jgi:hypothetical protein
MRTDYLPGRIEARSIDHGHTGRGCRAAIGRRARGVQTRSRLKQRLSAALLLVVLGSAGYADNVPHRTFEVRTYAVARDHLRALHDLFRNHSGRFFIKYGIQVIAFWTPQSDSPDESGSGVVQLICVLAHPDPEQARQAWQEFSHDEQWLLRIAESGLDPTALRPVSIEYFDPAYFSPLK